MVKKIIHILTLQDRGEKDHSLIDTEDSGEKHDSQIETRRSW